MATLVNYTCKSFIKLAPDKGLVKKYRGGGVKKYRGGGPEQRGGGS